MPYQTTGRTDGTSLAFTSGRVSVAFLVMFAASLCWPVYFTGYVFVFADTASYFRGGDRIWDVFFDLAGSLMSSQQDNVASAGAQNDALSVNAEGKNVSGRSFTYSAFASLVFRVAGLVGFALAQAALVTLMIALLVSREARQSGWILAIGAVFVAGLTGLPWYASYLMPDLFGAFVVLFGVILVRQIDDMGFWACILLLALTGFAASTHYGNMPLILAVGVAALGLRLVRKRLTWKSVVVGFVAISFAPLANIGASTVVLNESSMAPRRLPIVLSRSLADGPALWYLQDVCPDADLALCEAYGEDISGDTYWFLWSDEGVLSLSKEQLDRVREEELEVLIGTFLAYPVAQSKAFLRNGAVQLIRIGIKGLHPARAVSEDYTPVEITDQDLNAFTGLFDKYIIPFATLASVVMLLGFGLIFGVPARWVDILVMLGIGLLTNAYIFGGLSAPIDRYQGRVAWAITVLLFLYLAETATRRRRAISAPDTM